MKKIIFVTRKFSLENWGGMESFVLHSACALKKLGYSAKIYSTLAFSNKHTEYIDGIEVRRFPYIYPNLSLNKSKKIQSDMKYGNPICPSMFMNLLNEKDLYLIHTLNHTSLGIIIRLFSKVRKVPYVVSIYGGFGTHIKVKGKKAILKGKILSLLIQRSYEVLRDSCAIITDNIDEYKRWKKEFLNKPVYFIPLGANIEEFQYGDPKAFRDKYGIREQNIILNVARIDAQKNQIVIAKAAEEVLKVFPDTKFVFIGPVSDQQYFKDLQSTILKSPHKDKFLIIFGLKPGSKELVDAYSACDVFVIADAYGGPVVVLYEVWAVGKPVVSSRIKGDPGIISDGVDGLIFNSTSPSDLADKIVMLLSNKDLAKQIGLAGKRKVENKYSWDAVAKRLDEIYREL